MKPKRFKSKKNLEFVRNQPCIVSNTPPPSDVHHLRTRGGGGDDSLENLIPLSREYHQLAHKIGLRSFVAKFNLKISWDTGWPKRTDI